ARALRIAGGFRSFFGVQRFGSIRPITHVVGRHLVRGEFREAVEAYVANTLEGEDPESYEVRSALRDTGDIQTALRSYPKSYGFEKAILNHLAVEPTDYVGALRSLPFNLLMMIVASESLRPEDCIIPEIPRIASKGTRREILAPFRGLDVHVGEAAFSLSFELTRGSYATCLVREFTKSE